MPSADPRRLTREELLEEFRQRPTATIRETAVAIGVSSDTLYEAVSRGEAPWPVLRIGRRLLIPTTPLLASLGLPENRRTVGE